MLTWDAVCRSLHSREERHIRASYKFDTRKNLSVLVMHPACWHIYNTATATKTGIGSPTE